MKKLLVSLVLFVLFSISAKCNIVYYYYDASGSGSYTPTYVTPCGFPLSITSLTVNELNGYIVMLESGNLTYTEIADIESEARFLEDAINSMNQQQQDLWNILKNILKQIQDTAISIIRKMT